MLHRDVSAAAEVLPRATTRETPLQARITIDVVIPALNEESFIESVLHDVIMAKQNDWFQIQKIYVISDASTDQTDDIVQQFTGKDARIKLVKKPEE